MADQAFAHARSVNATKPRQMRQPDPPPWDDDVPFGQSPSQIEPHQSPSLRPFVTSIA
jgi:hypothetical protein